MAARYYECLVHPAFSLMEESAERVLILGGATGLALKEVLKHRCVEEVDVVVGVDVDTGPAEQHSSASLSLFKLFSRDGLLEKW